MTTKNILSEKIEISIEDHCRNMEGEEEIYCIINHIESETDYDYTFTASDGFFATAKDHMDAWAKENKFEITEITYA